MLDTPNVFMADSINDTPSMTNQRNNEYYEEEKVKSYDESNKIKVYESYQQIKNDGLQQMIEFDSKAPARNTYLVKKKSRQLPPIQKEASSKNSSQNFKVEEDEELPLFPTRDEFKHSVVG